MSFFRSIGVACGILVGIVLCVVIFRFANTDKKIRSSYDERQEAIRNVAYKYAFYTVLLYEVLMLILDIGEIVLPVPSYAMHFFGVILGCIVLGVYCIWKDVFWGMNNSRKRYFLVFILCLIFNLMPVIMASVSGSLIVDGVIGFPVVNIMVLVMFAIMLITMLLKSIVNKED
ncbi:MAG: hypothetical protein K5668_11355 [Lachnospiraceae bacterium]|nr:hypothetical protein [Lachnospiraceae bacterium]